MNCQQHVSPAAWASSLFSTARLALQGLESWSQHSMPVQANAAWEEDRNLFFGLAATAAAAMIGAAGRLVTVV